MIFAWDDSNREHLEKHGVTPVEAEEVVRESANPFPMEIGDEKLIVWGQTAEGRYLQVIYALKKPDDVEYESLSVQDWMKVESGEVERVTRVIHAMDLTPAMKKRLRRLRR